jgi:hypothetical protein
LRNFMAILRTGGSVSRAVRFEYLLSGSNYGNM